MKHHYDQLIQQCKLLPSRYSIIGLPACWAKILQLTTAVLLFPAGTLAQTDTVATADLKKLSLEELLNIKVTSVSKYAENLSEAASAIQVISNADIRHSGAKTLPEALRLASNLQVAQVNASQWAMSARGFNNVLSNKLLVLIDGRTIYTPMYGGVFWDVQNVMLEDVDRIEVISGPGGTLWGANAVNGVINIITKDAAETVGFYADVAHGTNLPVMSNIRYGGRTNDKLSYRAYATGFNMGNVADTLGRSANDQWPMAQAGFRSDYAATSKDKISVQANLYYGEPNPDGDQNSYVITRGDNITARWNRKSSDRAQFQLQAYYDHTWRDFRNQFSEDIKTYDIEWQNRYQASTRHIFTYGVGARRMQHKVANLELFGFFPGNKTLNLYNGFLQYEFMAVHDVLRLTLGSKLEHNTFTKAQHQPNVRVTWTPTATETVWAAVSRAVRNPSRTDRDFIAYITPESPLISGSNAFASETVVAYELGWRSKLLPQLTMSLSTFYNEYDELRSAEPGDSPLGLPITFANGVEGHTYGTELSFNSQFADWCRMRGGYTYLQKDMHIEPGSNDLNQGSVESNDPAHQFILQPSFTLPYSIDLGIVYRYIDKLPDPLVSSYSGLDVRIAWKVNANFEFNIIGQNLLHEQTTEYIASTDRRIIERNLYAKLICSF